MTQVMITLAFVDPDRDAEEREDQAQALLAQMRSDASFGEVSRPTDPNPPDGNKSLTAFLTGTLSTLISAENLKFLFGFFRERLVGSAVEFEVEAEGRKLKIKAGSPAELEAAVTQAMRFVGQAS